MPHNCNSTPAHGAELRVREARHADVDGLAALEAKAFSTDRLTRARLSALVKSASACLLVAHRGATLVGYALLLTRRNSRAARLYSLAVDPEMAGHGIGSTLLAASEAAARRRGVERLLLEVRVENRAAIRLYEQRGYKLRGRREDYYEDGAPALCYARELRDFCSEPVASPPLNPARCG